MAPRLPKRAQKLISSAVDRLYDSLKIRFLGPTVQRKKSIAYSYTHEKTLPGMFESANAEEGVKPNLDTLDSLMGVAEGYLDANRERTKAKLMREVMATLHDAHNARVTTNLETVLNGKLIDVLGEAQTNIEAIVNTETNTAKNLGVLDGVVAVNNAAGVDDPVVYFLIAKRVNPDAPCPECVKIHCTNGEGSPPRLWRLSSVGHGYHKKGEDFPAIGGLHPNCFVGDTRLHTNRGLLTVSELHRQGGELQVAVDVRVSPRREGGNQFGAEIPGTSCYHRHRSGAISRPTSHVYDTGIRECLRFTLETGHVIEVSEDHEMWVDEGNSGVRRNARDVKEGDKLPLLSGKGLFGPAHFPVEAELMGNLIGDGHLGATTASWNFFENDIEYGRELKQRAATLAPRLNSQLKVSPPNKKYQVAHATFNSQVLKRRFAELGLTDKSLRRTPTALWSADEETVCAFLRGLFAADGHSETNPFIVLAQNDLEFLREVQLLLGNLGLTSRIYPHGERRSKEITYADGTIYATERKPCWRLHVGGVRQVREFLERVGLGVPLKQETAQTYLMEAERRFEGRSTGHWRTARVAAVESIGPQQTYCLTEPMTHTVTANGLVVGQCRCTMVTLLPGYGFAGSDTVRFIEPGWDEYRIQQEEK